MNTMTLHTNHLYHQLKEDITNSSTIYVLSSFVMKSGIDMIWDDLQTAQQRGADIKILTGDYLYVTQPQALAKLLMLQGENLEIRLWQSNGIAFHPKAFIFKHRAEGAIIVGSSNFSRSALTSGVEWNLRMKRQTNHTTFDQAIHEFIELFYADETMEVNKESIKYYDEAYHTFHRNHADLLQTWTKREEIALTLPTTEDNLPTETKDTPLQYETKLTPRPAQQEALKALRQTVAEDYSKAMVVMATGLGKTYLAAFFAQDYPKILFIAHREEILRQAQESFEDVLDKQGGLYYGAEKSEMQDMLFASIFTLSIQEHLHRFEKDAFDLIIVDEFHHAAAKSYRKVIDYFEPTFLLGLTATPERTDGQDVFALCDGNVAYEISFIEAIQRGWLAPFTYYGVKDDIDYSNIQWLGSTYDQQQLMVEQINEQRAEQIFNKWMEHKQTRSLGFCSSIQQADFLAEFFIDRGIAAISLTSTTKDISRQEAIEKLETKEIDIIFTVDIFNEGVDIPSVDTLLFARPTESLVVFTQQIGRGLRKYPTKDTCVIIDLIGNYRHADTKLEVFAAGMEERKRKEVVPKVPENCTLHLETDVIDLLEEMKKKRSPRKQRIYEDYLRVKEHLGRRPTYREVHLYGKENSKEYRQAFGGYFAFLADYDELTEAEISVYQTYYQWLNKVEKEQMTKSYKMVVLEYLLQKGSAQWHQSVTPTEVAPYFHHFYMSKNYRKRIDFSSRNTKQLWDYDEQGVAKLIANMPMDKWVGKDGLVTFDGENFAMNFTVESEDEDILHEMTRQLCEYKMQVYFERKGYKKEI